MNDLWDAEYGLDNLDKLVEDNRGKEVTLCTVRSHNLLDTKIGNLFWVLLARRLAKNNSRVSIYDFPERGYNPSPLVVQQLADIFEVKNLKIVKAEDHPTDHSRKVLKKFARDYSENPDKYPGLIPSVSEGLLRSRNGQLDSSLERMCEELGVFLEGEDKPNAVQLSNHETETVQLVRYTKQPNKKFVRVDLGGIESEFRAERVAKIKDLPTKIILGKGLGRMYNHFNSSVLSEIASALSDIAYEHVPKRESASRDERWADTEKRTDLLLSKIDQLNPHLKTYLIILLEDKGHPFFIEPRVFGDELRRSTRHISKLESPDYTWVFNHLKQYNVGFGELKSFFVDLTKRAIPTIGSEELIKIGRHFYDSTNCFYSLMFFEEYIKREGKDKIGEVIDVYNTVKGSNRGSRALRIFIQSQSPERAGELRYRF